MIRRIIAGWAYRLRVGARALALAGIIAGISVRGVSAHVRWFAPDADRSIDRHDIVSGVTVLAVIAVLSTLGLAWLLSLLAARVRFDARLRALAHRLLARYAVGLPRPADIYPWIPALLAVHTAVILFVRGVERQLFVPNLALPYTLPAGMLALGEIVVAFSLIGGIAVGALMRPAAVGLIVLGLGGMVAFGPLLVIEHAYLFGIAAFLFITGRGPSATERIVRGPGRPHLRLLPYAVPILRASFGVATLVTGFTEKLWNRDLALAFLRDHPFNLTATTPFPLTDGQFVVAAGLAEVTLGALLVAGLWPRMAVLAAWVPFNLAVPFLGAQDVLGHLPIYGILLTILLCGSGRAFAATVRREVEPRSLVLPAARGVAALPPPLSSRSAR
jgi:hypothetical protein